jgi:predicted GNAT superfamily acetyltransferase
LEIVALQPRIRVRKEKHVTEVETLEIGQATEDDLEGILELQAANQAGKGGRLSVSLPRSHIAAMMNGMPLIVARRRGRVIGFLMTSTRAMNADIPVIRAMLAAHPYQDDAYVYGPICVDVDERGQGIAQAMFTELRRLQPGREGVLFIRRDNSASLRAHAKMEMREVASFAFRGMDHAVFSYVG